jgi:hypothetical protein
MSVIFDKFKERYPDHPLPYSEDRERWYEIMLAKPVVKHEYIQGPTKEDWDKYYEWSRGRKVEAFALFPPDVKKRLQPAIDELISLGVQDADLTGSFAEGSYCITDMEIVYKKHLIQRGKLSDVDVYIYDTKPVQTELSHVIDEQQMTGKSRIPIIRDGKIV